MSQVCASATVHSVLTTPMRLARYTQRDPPASDVVHLLPSLNGFMILFSSCSFFSARLVLLLFGALYFPFFLYI